MLGPNFFGTNPGDFLAIPRENAGVRNGANPPNQQPPWLGLFIGKTARCLQPRTQNMRNRSGRPGQVGWLIANTLPLGPRKYVLGPSWEAYAIILDNNGQRFIRWTKAHVYPNASFSKTEWRNWSNIALPNIRPCKSYTKWTSQRKTLPGSWTHELDMTSEL